MKINDKSAGGGAGGMSGTTMTLYHAYFLSALADKSLQELPAGIMTKVLNFDPWANKSTEPYFPHWLCGTVDPETGEYTWGLTGNYFQDYLSAVNNIDVQQQWGDVTGTVKSIANMVFPFEDVEAPLMAMVDAAVRAAMLSANQAASRAIEGGNLVVGGALDKASANINNIIRTADNVLASVAGQRVSDGDVQAFGIAETRQELIAADARALATTVLGDAHTGSQTAIVIGNAITAMVAGATDVLEGAVAAAGGALVDPALSAVLDNLVTAYEDRVNFAHQRAINRFTGGMVDINAVYSSAFGMGMTNLEVEYQIDVRKYEAELHHKLFEAGLQLFHSTFDRALAANLQTYMQELSTYLAAYTQNQTDELKIFLTALPEYLRVYLGGTGQYLNTYQDVEKGYETVAGGIYGSNLQNFAGALSDHVRAMTLTRAERMQARDQYIQRGVELMTNQMTQKVQFRRDIATLAGDLGRFDYVAGADYEDHVTQRHVKQALWGLDVMQYGANMLAAGAAGVVAPQADNTPSPAEALALGVMSTAALGGVSGVGLPAAVGVGALVALVGLME